MNNRQKKTDPRFSIILSVFVAITLWGYVLTEVNPQIDQKYSNIPVEIRNIETLEDNNLVLSEDEEYEVDFLVHGRKRTLFQLRSKIVAWIDVSDIDSKGTYDLQVKVDGIPTEIELLSKTPSTIPIEIDEVISDEKDVSINIVGTPNRDLATINYSVDSKTVTLNGPEKILNDVDTVTGEVNVQGATDDITQAVELFALDKNGKPVEGVEIQPKQVKVDVTIGQVNTVDLNIPLTGTPKEGYVVSKVVVLPSQITIGGKSNVISEIEKIDTDSIAVDNLDKTIEKEVGILLPESVFIVGAKPSVVVKVYIEKLETKEFTTKSIEYKNQPENMNIELAEIDQNYTITIQGRKEELNTIEISEIELFIDLKDVVLGDNTISVQWEPPIELDEYTITPKQVIVKASEKTE